MQNLYNDRMQTISNISKKALRILLMVLVAMSVAMLPGCSGNSDTSASTSGQSQQSSDEGYSQDAGSGSTGSGTSSAGSGGAGSATYASSSVTENGTYTSKDEVALYIHEFGHLPSNYITKTKAKKAGWDPDSGNLDEVLPGKSIGGGTFYNDDGLLPSAKGRTWKECDINYHGGYRGAERIVYSSDGLIYYTGDHYQTFERLY